MSLKTPWSDHASPGLLTSTYSFSKERQTFLACLYLREDTNPDDSETHALSPSTTFQAPSSVDLSYSFKKGFSNKAISYTRNLPLLQSTSHCYSQLPCNKVKQCRRKVFLWMLVPWCAQLYLVQAHLSAG